MRASILLLTTAIVFTVTAFGQYTASPAGPPPPQLSSRITAVLQPDGNKIVNGTKTIVEVWFRTALPSGPKSNEDAVSIPTVPQGALVGAMRVSSGFADRRGNQIKPGVYTLRYSNFPQNGDHQGVAPQRDFLLIARAEDDLDPASTPDFKKLVAMSEKATGIPHPGVFSIWKSDSDAKPGLVQQGEHDWVLQTTVGSTPLSIILLGKAEG